MNTAGLVLPSSRFSKVSRTLELMTYSAALVHLVQLERNLDMGVLLNKSPSSGAAAPSKDMSAEQLYQELEYQNATLALSQPTVEGIRILPYWQDNLLSNEERVMVAMFPIGAIYCALRSQLAVAEPGLSGSSAFSEVAGQLSIYEATTPDEASPTPIHNTDDQPAPLSLVRG